MKEFCESFKEPVKKIIGLEKIMLLLTKKELPKGHSTSNPCQYDVDITSIRRRPSFDEFPRHFHELFRCNFADRKVHVVPTYFFRRNFTGRKILVNSMYFFGVISLVEKSTLFPRIFFDVISIVEKSTVVSTLFFLM